MKRGLVLEAIVAIVAVLSIVRIAVILPTRVGCNDFSHYYLARTVRRETPNPYAASLTELCARQGLEVDPALPHLTDPPALLWFFSWMHWFPVRAAFWLWVCLQVGSLVALLAMTWRLVGDRLTPRGRRIAAGIAIASLPVYWHFYYSQSNLMLAALVLAGYMWSRDGKHSLSCAAIAIAGLLKIFPLVLLPWFAWRAGNRRGRLKCAAVAAVLVATGIGLTGMERWLQFLETGVPTFGRYAAMYFDCFSLPGLVARLGAGPLGQNLTAVAVVVVVYGLCWGATNREAEFCLLVTGMIGANLVGWAHYFVWLIFPVIVLAARPASGWSVTRGAALALLLLLLNDLKTKSTPWLDRHYDLKVLANSLPIIGLIAVGVIFARAVRREQS